MTNVAHILGEFIAAWNAGQRPRLAAYLERVPPAERDDLADQIETFLMLAAEPEYTAEAWAEMTSDPAVRAAAEAAFAEAEPWPSLLPRLRERAGVTWSYVAERLAQRFDFAGREEKATRYLEDMESGQLEPRRVSRRLLDALGELLGASAETLRDVGLLGGAMRPATAGGTLFRAEGDAGEWLGEDIEVLSRAAMAPAPAPLDEVDRLFVGGPEG